MPEFDEKFDLELIKSAKEKLDNKEPITEAEKRALKRFAKARDEKSRWDHYKTVSQKDYLKMAGRQAKVVYEQAAAHGLDIAGKTIDLTVVIRQWHDFLAKNKVKLAAEEVDPILSGPDSPWLEEIRKAEAGLRNIKLEREQKTHVNITDLKMAFSATFDLLRRTGETLQRNHGEDAVKVFNEGIDQVVQRCQAILSTAQSQ